MDASAIEQVLGGIAVETKLIGIAKLGLVPVRGVPHQRDAFVRCKLAAADLNRFRRLPAAGNEWGMNSQMSSIDTRSWFGCSRSCC